MKAWLLKSHRWLALIFALPLVAVIATGLVLSFEPWLVTNAIEPGSLSPSKIQALLNQHDPNGQARALGYRSYDHTLTLGSGRGGGIVVDTVTGQVQSGPSTLALVMGTSRVLHETLLLDAGWLVIASTAAMLVVVLLGGLMGWPRFANTMAGWHKAMAWWGLPLIVLSPLTGLLISAGITLTTPSAAVPAAQGAPLKLRVTPQGATPLQRNWPRLWHEGNFAGAWSAAMNVIVSFAMMGLLITGFVIWARRQLKRRTRRMP